MAESTEHLAGRIMRERDLVMRRQARFAKITDTGYEFARNIGEFVYETPEGERFQVQIRAFSEVNE
jgi:hypothetical protein